MLGTLLGCIEIAERQIDLHPGALESQTYVVESGDILSAIAEQFDTSVDAILEANDIEDPDRLGIGDELVIPAAE